MGNIGYLTKLQIINALYQTFNKTNNNDDNDIIITKYDFLNNNVGDYLIQFLNDYNNNSDSSDNIITTTTTTSNNNYDNNNINTMKVDIPYGMLPGDIIQVTSPNSKDIIYLCIPERNKKKIKE